MSAAPQPNLSPEAYLGIERKSEIRHQYYNGEMFAMSGASREHNRIVLRIGSELLSQLENKPCEPFVNDMRVKIDRSGLYTYPDIVVVRDEPRFEDDHVDTLLNPRLIIEVLSESTESYDRGKKFEHYRQLDSLKDYLLVSQDEPHIDHFTKNAGGQWLLGEATGLDAVLDLPTVDCHLALRDVFADIEFRGK